MPNICWWTITFYNPSKELREYLRDISKNKNASIEEFVCPMPPDIKTSTLPNSWSDAWHDWSCKNRGSKWGTYDHYIQEDKDDEIEITFSTAWSPIKDEILEKLSQHCDSLEYYFEEPWMNFSGERFAQDWEITESEDYEDAYFWDGVICTECWCINDPERYECQSCELIFSEAT